MYLRVATMMPLYFKVQTDELTAKRARYKKIFISIDLLVFVLLCGSTTYAIVIKHEAWYMPLFWCILTMTMTAVFGVSFLKIRSHTKGLAKTDTLGSKRLLYVHFFAFLSSSVCSLAYFVCTSTKRHLENGQKSGSDQK